MSKAKKAEIVRFEPEVKIIVEVDKKDLVNVAVATYESDLHKRQSTANKELVKNQTAISDADKTVTKVHEALAKKKLSAKISKVQTALKELGCNVILEIMSVSPYADGKKLAVKITDNQSNNRYRNCISFDKTLAIPTDTACKKAAATYDAALKKQDTIKDELIDIRKKLSELGTVERRARANLTVGELSRSEAGKKLLASLDLESVKKLAYSS